MIIQKRSLSRTSRTLNFKVDAALDKSGPARRAATSAVDSNPP